MPGKVSHYKCAWKSVTFIILRKSGIFHHMAEKCHIVYVRRKVVPWKSVLPYMCAKKCHILLHSGKVVPQKSDPQKSGTAEK